MAFQTCYEPERNLRVGGNVRLGIKKRPNFPSTIWVTLRFQWASDIFGWREGTQICVDRGTGEHDGILAFRSPAENDKRRITLTLIRGRLAARVQSWGEMQGIAMASRPCEIVAENSRSLMFKIPVDLKEPSE